MLYCKLEMVVVEWRGSVGGGRSLIPRMHLAPEMHTGSGECTRWCDGGATRRILSTLCKLYVCGGERGGRGGRLTSGGSLRAALALHTHWVSHNQKAWGYVLIILLNSDEILNSLSLRLRVNGCTKQSEGAACAPALTCVFTSVQDISI